MVRTARPRSWFETGSAGDAGDGGYKAEVESLDNAQKTEREGLLKSFPFSLSQRIDQFEFQFMGIVIVALPALPAGNRFCLAMRSAVGSPPEAWTTRPDSS